MALKPIVAWVVLAVLLGRAPLAMAGGSPAPGPSLLVIFLTDESLYLCPLCGDRFLAAYRRVAAQVGPVRIWVAVAGEKSGKQAGSSDFRAAVKKHIEAFLRSNGIICPVLDDPGGVLRGPDGILPACLTFDAAGGAVRSFALVEREIKKRP